MMDSRGVFEVSEMLAEMATILGLDIEDVLGQLGKDSSVSHRLHAAPSTSFSKPDR